jgi:hypothetical protein
MRVHGLLSLTLPADNPDEVRRWWAETLGLIPAEDDPEALDLGEVAVRFGEFPLLRVVGSHLADDESVQMVDPAGTVVVVVPPDRAAAVQAEDSIREFVAGADALPGPPVAEVADEVAALAAELRDRLAAHLADLPHNKVLAVQLELGQRARQTPTGDIPWHLHAASTLMSGLVVAGAEAPQA